MAKFLLFDRLRKAALPSAKKQDEAVRDSWRRRGPSGTS